MRASRGVGGCAALPPSAHPLGSTKKRFAFFPFAHTAVCEGVFLFDHLEVSCTEILNSTCTMS